MTVLRPSDFADSTPFLQSCSTALLNTSTVSAEVLQPDSSLMNFFTLLVTTNTFDMVLLQWATPIKSSKLKIYAILALMTKAFRSGMAKHSTKWQNIHHKLKFMRSVFYLFRNFPTLPSRTWKTCAILFSRPGWIQMKVLVSSLMVHSTSSKAGDQVPEFKCSTPPMIS